MQIASTTMATRWPLGHATLLGAIFLLPAAIHAEAPKWNLAWQDDFEAFDESRWLRVETNKTTNKSLQAYLPEQVSVEDGKLVITATNHPHEGLAFRSGQVFSRESQKHGRWEVRAKLPTTRGMWPAIWLLADTKQHPWPSGGEIDIMENRGNQPLVTSSAFHYGTNPPFKHDFVFDEQSTSRDGQLADYHNSFHVYAVDWTERYLRFYVDGVHYYTVFDEDVGRFLSERTQPMQLIINNAIGGTFLPDPDDSTEWPQRMEIDWVRVYTLDEEPGRAELANGGFDAEGGSLSAWSLFGAKTAQIQNTLAASEAVLDGEASLKLFGNFGLGGRYNGVSQGISVDEGQPVEATASVFVRSEDSIAGTGNRLLMKLEFYDAFGAKHGPNTLAETELIVADGNVTNDSWKEHRMQTTAPPGAVEARLALVFDQPSSEGGAVHIDSVAFRALPR